MATAADLNELMDRLGRTDSGSLALKDGYSLYRAAYDAGLVAHGEMATVAYWVGELVRDGRAAFRTVAGGVPAPSPGVTWGDRELQSHYDYFLTGDGRADAREFRRLQRRADAEETVVAIVGPSAEAALPDAARAALAHHLRDLQATLASSDPAATIGAAKELVEAAAKVVLDQAGAEVPDSGSLSPLYRRALSALRADTEGDASGWTLARGLAGVVGGLAELRNVRGRGHGRALPPKATSGEARLAAHAAVGATLYLFADCYASSDSANPPAGAP